LLATWYLLSAAHRGRHESPLEVCPIPAFRRSLSDIVCPLLNNTCERAGGAAAILASYLAKSAGAVCLARPEPPAWPKSARKLRGKRGMLVNAGAGSTGTRFLGCLVHGALSNGPAPMVEKHGGRLPVILCNVSKDGERYGAASGMNCTEWWDSADYVSDDPIPEQLAPLLATHRNGSIAGVLLSLRSPWDWAKTRRGMESWERTHRATFASRLKQGVARARDVTPPMPCSGGGNATSVTDPTDPTGVALAQDLLAYNAWAHCAATRAGLPVYTFSLFDMPPATFEEELWRFFASLPDYADALQPLPKLHEHANRCRHAAASPSSVKKAEAAHGGRGVVAGPATVTADPTSSSQQSS
jgi:hypothetical protein